MIGIFDSGSGGLTVLRAIRDRLPSADILYYGDTKNAPYGEKDRDELSHLTIAAIEFLKKNGATAFVSACNSLSASLAVSIFDMFDIPHQNLIDMVGPTVAYLRTTDAKLLFCATPATIRSGIYQNAFKMIGKNVETLAIAGLGGAIEFGNGEEVGKIIRDAFSSLDRKSVEGAILACTHYPLAIGTFRKALGPGIHIFDPAEAVASRVEKQFWPREVGDGAMRLCITKDSEHFRRFAEELFPDDEYDIEVIE